MAAEVEEDESAKPYIWEEAIPPAPDVLQLWTEVGNGLDKNQTVVWKSAVESLDYALKHLTSAPQAREFVESYMTMIIGILVEQQPSKIGVHERNCVQESLLLAVRIVALDLAIQTKRQSVSKLLPTLSHIFNKKKAFYKGSKGGSWNVNHHHHLVGMPEVRLRTLDRFRAENGFRYLHEYLQQRHQLKSCFPSLLWIHDILCAAGDAIPTRATATADSVQEVEDDAILLSKAVMDYINGCSEEELKKIPTDELKVVQTDLQRIFDRLVATRRSSTYDFYAFWRALVLKLITSKSLPLKLFGWEQVGDLIRACESHRPPPRSYIITSAGSTFVNGPYQFAGEITPDGYARQGTEFSYVREIPSDTIDGAGKKLTLFRCTMRSQQKWWFLSEADEEQPGTDRDIDYYQHKAKDYEEAFPPMKGWITCRNAGVDPPPVLEPQGVLVPAGAEFETLEHQLAKWAIENEIVEQVLGDTTIHREVVSRSTVLIKFLASMCTRVAESGSRYCLQASHLLFAWKTCTRKADAAVSLQVYQLLVSILPLCPSSLAIPLLRAVQTSLHESDEKRDYLFEVSEFCSALADANLVDSKSAKAVLSDDVREEALNLLWSVLTHPDASSLKSYDSLKQYVTHELKVEPKGSEHRERFLTSCVVTLAENERIRAAPVNEVQSLRMVKLLDFVLEACPRVQAEKIASHDGGRLPLLVFHEMTAYLDRRKHCNKSLVFDETRHADALQQRLRIVRHVFGYSVDPLGVVALKELWELCTAPTDREAVMVFIANASHNGKPGAYNVGSIATQPETVLTPALTEDVCRAVFLDLFCSPMFNYEELGESAYHSFQILFNQLRTSFVPPLSKRVALDALWRMCLTVQSDTVAEQAMKDLLGVYISLRTTRVSPNGVGNSLDTMVIDENDESFENRIYECLSRLREDLLRGSSAAELSIQRCLRILKAAIGENEHDPLATSSTLTRLSHLSAEATLDECIRCLPHGMRGQACYRRIGIIAKGSNQRPPTTSKFSLDVHPLETLASLKSKVATACQSAFSAVKAVQINGRSVGTGIRSNPGDSAHLNLSIVPEDSVMDELGIVQGCEVVFVVAERPPQNNPTAPPAHTSRGTYLNDLSAYFFADGGRFADRLHTMLLGILESLQMITSGMVTDAAQSTHKLVWDLLLAMPTDIVVANKVRSFHNSPTDEPSVASSNDAMEVEPSGESWLQLLDITNFDRSVYVLMTIDAFLQPAPEALSILSESQRLSHEKRMLEISHTFRRSFIDAGGFSAVVRFFSAPDGDEISRQSKTRRGNAVALRILKSCLFGNDREVLNRGLEITGNSVADEAGMRLLQSLSDVNGLLKSLTAMVVDDEGISSSTIADVLRFLSLLFQSPRAAQSFVSLKGAERFLVALLLWDGGANTARTSSSVSAAMQVRRTAHDLILQVPLLADYALPWLMNAVGGVDTALECTSEFFDVLEKLVDNDNTIARSRTVSENDLRDLGVIVCKKLASCPRPISESEAMNISTGVLCGCLKLLRALIEKGGGKVLREASETLLSDLRIEDRWSTSVEGASRGAFSLAAASFDTRLFNVDSPLVDIMGAIFDGFLSPNSSSGVAICCDKESRRRGFDVIGAAARSCESIEGYTSLVSKVSLLIDATAPKLRHRWGQFGNGGESRSRGRNSSKYSGLRNQGCTCYMNSVLQQLFMMPELRDSMCSAPLPSTLRSSGSAAPDAGADLVGKKITLQWDTGVSYDAIVESFDRSTGMHTIRYVPIQVAVGGTAHHQVQPEEVSRLPPPLPDEFVLSEGRPGKETGVFEIVADQTDALTNGMQTESVVEDAIKENEDEAASRHLLEEVQRTFIHLKEGSKGRCFDPRVLVEACACLKLEFDVWQQNDASEFATKLLDRLEISLKKWAPGHFAYMDHTFGIKQTKQKICKECGLKTNREEKLLNIDCQIRGKSDINEALAAMTEVEIMEGSNKVYCDHCKKNTDTILRTAISTLPNMLLLSLKRFDLDYTTFETVKLNSRCAFGQTLNMKKYTLEGLETDERTSANSDPSPMETDDTGFNKEDDENYEYRLVGVLVHAGVAQGGHYYSFIKDRNPGSEEKWFRFDDEDVTPFDPALIESECFGGKVKKETKWPNGQVHTVEQEQFANALMLFYEKVKPTAMPEDVTNSEVEKEPLPANVTVSTGYDAFEPDVRTSNTAHRWQSFLFDSEFQSFLKGLLGLCRLSKADQKFIEASDGKLAWVPPMTEMIISFVFDVLFYSSEFTSLNEWIRLLEELLVMDNQSAVAFVRNLARRTRAVSANWLRTFLLECPEKTIRTAAVRIFYAAVMGTSTSEDELKTLESWTQAWKDQVNELGQSALPDVPISFPCTLEGRYRDFEDIDNLENGGASSIGIILSFMNVLLDAIPRCWRFASEACLFIRNLARINVEGGKKPLQKPMVQAMIPARLVALLAREQSPAIIKAAFPAASVSQELANIQTRAESNPSSHVVPMATNTVLNPEMSNQRGPCASDYLVIFEALVCIGGLNGAVHSSLVLNDEMGRSRQRYLLSEKAAKALRIVFQETCAPGAPGMGKRELETYLRRCGIDRGNTSPQKVHDIMTKYPTAGVEGSKGEVFLSLEGFLQYYRDCVQSNDMRLRLDLHTFGFRPDLSRRSKNARMMIVRDRDTQRETLRAPYESVAVDVSEIFGEHFFDVGRHANVALASTVHIHSMSYTVSEPMMQYLVAASVYGKDAEPLINRTLQTIYQTPNDWAGNEKINGAMMILQTIASTPGEHQQSNIAKIMLSTVKPARTVNFGGGLLEVTRALQSMTRATQYSNDVYLHLARYMGILRDLRSIYSIFQWMNENRSLWSFVERDLLDQRLPGHPQQHGRNDYATQDLEHSIPLDHNTHSDSDMAGMNDSEDDEDSQYDNIEGQLTPVPNDGPFQITVQGAGNPAVNGVYSQDGLFSNACRYAKQGRWNSNDYKFYIFQCHVSNNTRHWYISIVPFGGNPGTSSDIDFYTAPVTEECKHTPPRVGWVKTSEGKDPAPVLEFRFLAEEPESGDVDLSGPVVEDENDDAQQHAYV